MNVQISKAIDLKEAAPVQSAFEDTVSLPSTYQALGKRAFDVFLVLFMAPMVLVVVAIMAAVVALDGKSPFYLQKRVGKNGQIFNMIKMRSMIHNADAVLEDHLQRNPAARSEWNTHQKLTNDPRITWFGRLIRQTSLDELPQLINVLKGEMSLVGPRPMMCDQRAIYPGTEYYAMRPGITGYWQTSLRNESAFRERARFDTAYFHDQSLVTDLKILLATIGVVIKATGK
ncbi:MAG: sugar transferase [Thalassovita sp.]